MPEDQDRRSDYVQERFHLDKRAKVLATLAPDTPPDVLLDTVQLANWLMVTPHWLDVARLKGNGPNFIRVGNGIRYFRADVLVWLEERRHKSTSEYISGKRSGGRKRKVPAVEPTAEPAAAPAERPRVARRGSAAA